jgi:hypothetical protein
MGRGRLYTPGIRRCCRWLRAPREIALFYLFKMGAQSYSLSSKDVFTLAVLECLFQGRALPDVRVKWRNLLIRIDNIGILIPMVISSSRAPSMDQKPQWFKVYVMGINGLSLTQTILVIIQGFFTLTNGLISQTVTSISTKLREASQHWLETIAYVYMHPIDTRNSWLCTAFLHLPMLGDLQ